MARLTRATLRARCASGPFPVEQGDAGDSFYVIVDGEAVVTKTITVEVRSGLLGSGASLGAGYRTGRGTGHGHGIERAAGRGPMAVAGRGTGSDAGRGGVSDAGRDTASRRPRRSLCSDPVSDFFFGERFDAFVEGRRHDRGGDGGGEPA